MLNKKKMTRTKLNTPIPLNKPVAGSIVWAKFAKSFWPALIVAKKDWDFLDHFKKRDSESLAVFWFGSENLSAESPQNVFDFYEHFNFFHSKMIVKSKLFTRAVEDAILEYRHIHGLPILEGEEAVGWASLSSTYANGIHHISGFSHYMERKLCGLRESLQKQILIIEEGGEEPHRPASKDSDNAFKKVWEGVIPFDQVCLACSGHQHDLYSHPTFKGNICSSCYANFKRRNFSLGVDGVNYYCAVCWQEGILIICGNDRCYRNYCEVCIKEKASTGLMESIEKTENWLCFLCDDYSKELHGFLEKRTTWFQDMLGLFHPNGPKLKSLQQVSGGIRLLCLEGSGDMALRVLSELKFLNVILDMVYCCKFSREEWIRVRRLNLERGVLQPREESIDEMEDPVLVELSPVHVVIAKISGEDILTFLTVLRTINLLNLSCVPNTLFIIEVEPPSNDKYNKALTRFLEIEPAILPTHNECNFIWTNMLELRKQMCVPAAQFSVKTKTEIEEEMFE